jgi:hypothetical protein
MDHGMGPDFEADQNEGDHRKNYLQSLGALLPRAQWLAPPLGGGTRAQAPDPGEDGQVDERAGGGEGEHGNADGVLMKAAGGGVNAACRGQCGKTNGDTDAADSENCRADALQESDDEAGAAQAA